MSIERQLAQLKTAHRRQVRTLVFVRTVWLMAVIGLALIYGDLFFQFNDPSRLSLDGGFAVLLIGAVVLTWRWLTGATSEARRVARLVEEGNPDLHNDLVSAIDFEEAMGKGSGPAVSRELMQHQIGIAAEKARRLKRLDSLKPPSLKQEARLLLASLGMAVILLLVFTSHFAAVIPRFVDPFGDHPPYSPTSLKVNPTGTSVDYGQGLKIDVETGGPRPAEMTLVLRDKEGRERATLPMLEESDGRYFQNIENVQDDLEYFVRIPGGRSKRYALLVIKWPKIQSATVAYEYPAYTQLPAEKRYLNDRVVKGYRETRVTLALHSNRPLKGGVLTVCGADYELAPGDANSVTATFVISTNGPFSATITDKDGNVTREKLEGTVEVLPDLKPEIAIVSPGMDSFATPDARIPINIEARDDLGVGKVEILRSRSGSADERKTVHNAEGREKFVNVIEELDLEALGVKPGDTIEYYATTTDSAPGVSQTTATPAYRLAIISQEQYRDLLQTQMSAEDLTKKYDELMEQLKRLADKQAALEKEIGRLKNNLEQNGSLTPQEQQQMQQGLAAQEQLARQTGEFARELQEEAKRPSVFDVEKDYKKALEKFSERMAQAQQAMSRSAENLKKAGEKPGGSEGLPGLNSALQDQREALAQLGQNRDEFEKGIQQANRDIEKLYRLLGDVETFKALLERQKNLERQARSYKDVADPGLDEQIRLKEFAEEQEAVEQSLSDLREDFIKHAEEVAQEYPKVADDGREIADQIRERQIEDLMESGATRLSWADAKGGHEKVRTAYDEMQAMVEVCNSAGGQAQGECEFRLKMTMNMSLGNTLQQLAKGLKPGSGFGMGSGF
ncbi:MAG TPA: hypothetical protein VJW76_13875, partial [Verrucomicrobiae bacterium]|nr:hypothetical protein [Verrucomicrobiae bacterium]